MHRARNERLFRCGLAVIAAAAAGAAAAAAFVFCARQEEEAPPRWKAAQKAPRPLTRRARLKAARRSPRPVGTGGQRRRRSPRLPERRFDLPTVSPQDNTAKGGFRIIPVKRSSYVNMRHPAFPTTTFRLMLPEYAYRDEKTRRSMTAENVVWTEAKDGKSARFHWGITEALKKERGVDLWGDVEVLEDGVAFTLSMKNLRDKPWSGGSLVCLRPGSSVPFVDYDAERTYMRRGGRLMTVHEAIKGKFPSNRMVWPGGSDGMTARVTTDGRWVLAIAVDLSPSLSFNFRRHMSCLHSNPIWGIMKPGETKTARGRVYLFQGTISDVWRKYRRDFNRPSPSGRVWPLRTKRP